MRIRVKVFCIISVLLGLIGSLVACAETHGVSEPEYAGAMTESLLLAINEDDYATFCEHLDASLGASMTEPAFDELVTTTQAEFGKYVSKEYKWKKKVGYFTQVNYDAEFSNGPDSAAIVKISFHEVGGEMLISSFAVLSSEDAQAQITT